MKAILNRTEHSTTYSIRGSFTLRVVRAKDNLPGASETVDFYLQKPFATSEDHYSEQEWGALVEFIKENYYE